MCCKVSENNSLYLLVTILLTECPYGIYLKLNIKYNTSSLVTETSVSNLKSLKVNLFQVRIYVLNEVKQTAF